MKHLYSLVLGAVMLLSVACSQDKVNKYDSVFSGHEVDRIAYPIGGLGAGMFCLEGTGAISHMSVRNAPDMFNEPCMFAAIHVDGVENGTKVVEGEVPAHKAYGRPNVGTGRGSTTYGMPRFENCSFKARFPFAQVDLDDPDLPLTASITGWSPFIPSDEDNSGLPVGGLEYTFTNTSSATVRAVFSYSSRNFMYLEPGKVTSILPPPGGISQMPGGFVLHQDPSPSHPELQGDFAIFTPLEKTNVDARWFRGEWFDSVTMAWKKVDTGDTTPVQAEPDSRGASLYVPFELAPGESHTVRLLMAWYVPNSKMRTGTDAANPSDFGDRYDPSRYEGAPSTFKPWYATRFASIGEVTDYWKDNYDSLRAATSAFTEAFYDTTLPVEVTRVVADNLTVLKSPTILRQHDGRLFGYEGCKDTFGTCPGTTTHVWNYVQTIPHLFPRLERTLRDTEFIVDQDTEGHQAFRSCLPVRPVSHDFHSAADGQLGGIIKIWRDWRISGDTDWIRDWYPLIKKSMDYCIRTWDPRMVGALEEPHHNTYDIEFWGADGMCTSFYTAALEAFVDIAETLGEDASTYAELLAKSRAYMENDLWNGEYFYQRVQWEGLSAGDPTQLQSYKTTYSPEALEIFKKEGPKYQYGDGLMADGIVGCWMALCAGLDEPVDPSKVKSHLESVYKYNLKHDLYDCANTQRPMFAFGHEGGVLNCTWPRGGKPDLPMVYANESLTGIELEVAAHLMFEGDVEEGLDIVRVVLDKYDGSVRNPFNEIEYGYWYSRAMSSYSLLQALTGVRYDAVDKTLYIDSKVGDDFRSFLAFDGGYATVGLRRGQPFVEVKAGELPVDRCLVSGREVSLEN